MRPQCVVGLNISVQSTISEFPTSQMKKTGKKQSNYFSLIAPRLEYSSGRCDITNRDSLADFDAEISSFSLLKLDFNVLRSSFRTLPWVVPALTLIEKRMKVIRSFNLQVLYFKPSEREHGPVIDYS